ncbi:hypothetical protein QZH41_013233 [Actinostola sp. cb2023]|nr:hypothetical protein QZH41_013233 [Actinostola sp. cb2023]
MCQSPIQAIIRPAMWIPGIKKLHSAKETWVIPQSTVEVCVEQLIEAVNELGEKEKMHVNKVNRNKNFVQIFSFTNNEWFDVVEIEFQPGRESGSIAKARSFSTGVLPTCCPFAIFLNIIFCFVPFLDNGVNKERLNKIRTNMRVESHVEEMPDCPV